MHLEMPVKEAGKIYKVYATRLEKLGILTLEDFFYHIPSRYENYSLVSPISKVQAGEVVTIKGTLIDIKNEFTKNYKKLQKATIQDPSGTIDVVWFNQPYLTRILHKDDAISLSGKINWFAHKLVLETPDYEILTENETIHTGRLVPIYPETHGVSSKWLRRQIYKLLKDEENAITDALPNTIIERNHLLPLSQALWDIHFPKNIIDVEKARERLAFDELFFLQLAGIVRRAAWGKKLKGNIFAFEKYKDKIEEFWEKLPFALTQAQKKALDDIFKDVASEKPMNRLLEGDVGSGKTVVATVAMYLAYLNGFQSVLMAPTEILAQQHYATISKLLEPLGVTIGLQTGSSKYYVASSKNKKEKDIHNTKYQIPTTDILIGTHAVLSKQIIFDKLGLVVIDEQQRFGVEQRSFIRKKGHNPHLLTMTATPIPRTVALTMYGDLDVSYLDELPKGRQIIKTWLVPEEKRSSAYVWIAEQINATASQVFIICPFIEESESMATVKAATKEFERLQRHVFPSLKLGLLHGRIKSKEKDAVLTAFREKAYDILVATPVVEVGIDIPNATIMIIEAAERFGLSQLHQLRGRVGRGEKQSYCLLFTEAKNEQTIKRLKAMETMHIGADLAELDLRLRGPGDVFGTMQHGTHQLKIAHFSDFALIEKTKKEAAEIFPSIHDFAEINKRLTRFTTSIVLPD